MGAGTGAVGPAACAWGGGPVLSGGGQMHLSRGPCALEARALRVGAMCHRGPCAMGWAARAPVAWCVIGCGPERREVPWRGTCKHLRQAGRSGCCWLHPEPEGDPLRAMGLGSYCFLYKQPSPAPGLAPTVRPLLGRLA